MKVTSVLAALAAPAVANAYEKGLELLEPKRGGKFSMCKLPAMYHTKIYPSLICCVLYTSSNDLQILIQIK